MHGQRDLTHDGSNAMHKPDSALGHRSFDQQQLLVRDTWVPMQVW